MLGFSYSIEFSTDFFRKQRPGLGGDKNLVEVFHEYKEKATLRELQSLIGQLNRPRALLASALIATVQKCY